MLWEFESPTPWSSSKATDLAVARADPEAYDCPMTAAESTSTPGYTTVEWRARRREHRASALAIRANQQATPVYEYRYLKDDRGRSVKHRRPVSGYTQDGAKAQWEVAPRSETGYSTFDNSRLTYARSAGLPSLGRKYAPGNR